jgi:protein SCO1
MKDRIHHRSGVAAHIGGVLVGLALVLLFASGCDSARAESSDTAPSTSAVPSAAPASVPGHDVHRHAPPAAPEAGEHTDYSIYHLESTWWDQAGNHRRLESLAGRVQIVSMVYTYCAHTCPRILMDMKRIEGALEGSERDGVGFVLVSIDPERDTADRLRHFAESTRLDPNAWTLLSGSDGDILELATLLGVKFRRDSETDFSHSNVLLVLNPAGEIVFRQLGLGADPAPLLEAVRAVAGG